MEANRNRNARRYNDIIRCGNPHGLFVPRGHHQSTQPTTYCSYSCSNQLMAHTYGSSATYELATQHYVIVSPSSVGSNRSAHNGGSMIFHD